MELVEGRLTETAHRALAGAFDAGTLMRTQGIPLFSAPVETLYRFSANGESYELTHLQSRAGGDGSKRPCDLFVPSERGSTPL